MEELTCPICLELFVGAADTNCGHCFCCTCLADYLETHEHKWYIERATIFLFEWTGSYLPLSLSDCRRDKYLVCGPTPTTPPHVWLCSPVCRATITAAHPSYALRRVRACTLQCSAGTYLQYTRCIRECQCIRLVTILYDSCMQEVQYVLPVLLHAKSQPIGTAQYIRACTVPTVAAYSRW
jgi:RING finger family protein